MPGVALGCTGTPSRTSGGVGVGGVVALFYATEETGLGSGRCGLPVAHL